jgi:tRNA threonylcarbamoyladenosine biosynthesis protein TsaB
MLALALDSSANACSAALWRDGRILAHRLTVMERGQAEHLLPMVADVLAEGGADGAGLDLLAVTVGPGAFTGIRIGLAAARGLALAWGVRLVGVSTLQAVAAGVAEEERRGRTLVAVMDTKRADLWVQPFDDRMTPLGGPRSIEVDEMPAFLAGLERPLLVGDAARTVQSLAQISGAPFHADARKVAELAVAGLETGAVLPPDPLYLRPADVTMPKPS